MKKNVKTLIVFILTFVMVLSLTGCGSKISEKNFEKIFDIDQYHNCVVTVEKYKKTDLEEITYMIQDDLIYCKTLNYENGELTSSTYQYFKENEDGKSDAYLYDNVNSEWSKLESVSEINREYILGLITDFVSKEYSEYTYNSEFKEYIKNTDNGLIELAFKKNKLYQAMNNFKENVSGTRITITSYGLVRKLSLPEVSE